MIRQVEAGNSPNSLMELLQQRCDSPLDIALRFLQSGEVSGPAICWSWRDLDRRAREIAGRLQTLGYAGERALMLFPPGPEFLAAFFGCIYARVVAVPAYPPDPTRIDATLPRLQGIARSARPAVLLTTSGLAGVLPAFAALAPELAVLQVVTTDDADPGWANAWRRPGLTRNDLAFLQYTSGSTGQPKGVMISHGNLLANLEMIESSYVVDGPSLVSWLPPFHDMGLIGAMLGPVILDMTVTFFSPIDFIKRPIRWLQAISHFGASISGAPNFAYALVAKKATPDDVAKLDLSRWQLAFCGAEPVRADTLHAFANTFAPAGFRRRAFNPTYGLAEATLLVTGGNIVPDKYLQHCDTDALRQGEVKPGTGQTLVSSGSPILDTEVAILRADGTPCAENLVGEIGLRGPAVAAGYWELPEQTAARFHWRAADGQTWLRTGDLGFIHDGQLFVTGRTKDLLVIRGRNHYPQDIEATVEAAHPAVRAGCVAAFAIAKGATETLAVVAEVRHDANLDTVEAAIRKAIASTHELKVDGLALIAPRAIPKTTSGKIQRQACRQAWLEGTLPTRRRVGAVARPGGLPEWLVKHLVDESGISATHIRPEVTLQQLGLDSMAMVQLAGVAEERIGVEVPVEIIFDRTLAEIAAWVDHTGLPTTMLERPDLEAAAALDPSIQPRVGSKTGQAIFLTGATGLVGAHLLAELLARSHRRVICLVRANDVAHAQKRITEVANRLQFEVDTSRLEFIVGDLAKPRFGLSPAAFEQLAGATWRIVHCGARVDWSARFEELRAANVGGTIEVIRLAAMANAAIHHVSSLGVYPLGLSNRAGFDEHENVSEGASLRVPYFQSKWAAERALEHAQARGIAVAIYRPGFVTGHSKTGIELDPASQLFAAFVSGIVRLGTAPAVDKVLGVVPVDFVAAAIAALSLGDDTAGQRFTLLNPHPIQQSAFYKMLRGRAYRIRPMAYPRWREQVLRLPREDRENSLARFALYYRTVTPQVMRRLEATLSTRIPIDDGDTRARLAALGIRCPPVDAQLLDTYLDAYVAAGLLPSPRIEVGEERPAHAPTLLELEQLAAPWRAAKDRAAAHKHDVVDGLNDAESRMIHLYDLAKKRQWDAHERLDWSLEIDPENPQQLPDASIPIFRSPVWEKLGPRERVELRRHHQAWQLSQFLAGEQGALLCAGRIVQNAPNAAARMYCATQVVDEARHIEVFARLLHQKIGLSHTVSPSLQRLLDDVLYDRRWDLTCLGMQVLIEGLGLAVFAMIRDRSQHPLVAAAYAYVAQDEARHVAFGRIQLSQLYRELSASELREREEFVVEASYLLRDRFAARDLWEHLGLPVDRCVGWIEDSGYMHHYRAELFRRIVPIVRAIGLWSPRVQDAYARMGILDFAEVEVDALMAEDEAIAERFDSGVFQLPNTDLGGL